MTTTNTFTNHFLIAMPALADPNFFHSVTYVCEHSADGALGIVINRPMDITLTDVLAHMSITLRELEAGELIVYVGGPVQPERGFVLHRPPKHWESTLQITPSLAVTTSKDILTAIAKGKGPERALVALGYAGWGPGQLERELADNAWLSGPADESIILTSNPTNAGRLLPRLWASTFRAYRAMSATPDSAITVLGFDFGTKHIGVAIGQTVTGTARPLQIITSPHQGKHHWKAIAELVNEWQPQAFVVGMPYNMDGSDTETTDAARRFANQLRGRFGRPVHEVDERLSSVEARYEATTKQFKNKLDHHAAALIVGDWLRQQSSQTRDSQSE